MRKSRLPSFGREEFPRRISGGRQIGQTPLRRCVRCGTPNDTRSTGWADNGDGVGAPTDVIVNGVTQNATKDRAHASGCMFCDSTHWLETQPTALPDDRYFPSDDRRRNKKGR